MVVPDVSKFSVVGTDKFEDDPIGSVHTETPDFVVCRVKFLGLE